MTKIIVSGCNGKMGQVISRLAEEKNDIEIVAGIDINTQRNFDYYVFKEPDDCNLKADVIIDFSHPALFDKITDYAVRTSTPIIVCTTGLSDKQKAKLKEISEKTAVFFSANMSLGVNLITNLVQQAAKVLEDNFDIEIIEKHHNQKIDAPSGTALAIADAINEAVTDKKEYVYDRHSYRNKRSKSEIGIHSLRGGTIVGEHSVIFAGCDEVIEIKHSAMSKEIFAVGAITAAKFMCGKEPGYYSMKNLM